MRQGWLRVAHRGASGSAPEHTNIAFRRALEIGVDMIELDVQLSRDGELVVLHDFELGRTTNGTGAVREQDWHTLRQLDAGSWFSAEYAGERVLKLDEVVDLVDGRARLNVEIKGAGDVAEPLATKVVDLLARRNLLSTTIISCFDFDVLRAARRCSDAIALGLLTHQPDLTDVWDVARDMRAASVHPYFAFATRENVERAHQEGLDVIVWTVNDVEAMEALIDRGVDGIISDYPERFASLESTQAG